MFRPVKDTEELLVLMTTVRDGTLDAHSRADLRQMSAREAAVRQYEDEFAGYSSPRDWWRIATLPEGDPVGFVILAVIAYSVLGYSSAVVFRSPAAAVAAPLAYILIQVAIHREEVRNAGRGRPGDGVDSTSRRRHQRRAEAHEKRDRRGDDCLGEERQELPRQQAYARGLTYEQVAERALLVLGRHCRGDQDQRNNCRQRATATEERRKALISAQRDFSKRLRPTAGPTSR